MPVKWEGGSTLKEVRESWDVVKYLCKFLIEYSTIRTKMSLEIFRSFQVVEEKLLNIDF